MTTKSKHTLELNDEDIKLNKIKLESDVFADGSRSVPFISVVKGRKFIPWQDSASDIQYPIQLLRLYKNSVLHYNIIEMKNKSIMGEGIQIKDEDKTDPILVQNTYDFINKLNSEGDDFTDVMYKAVKDYLLFGWVNCELRFDKLGDIIKEVKHLESHKLRVQTPDENGNIYGLYWRFNWEQYSRSDMVYFDYFNYAVFKERQKSLKDVLTRLKDNNNMDYENDMNEYKELLKSGKSFAVHSFKTYKPNEFYYPTPEYVAGCTEIESDIASSVYCLNALKNGMDNGMMITMPGDLSDKDTRDEAVRFMKNYIDGRSKGQPILFFSNDMENKPTVTEFGNGNSLAAKYRSINEDIQNKIVMIHQIPSGSMIGIQTAGKLGNTNENEVHQEIFNMNYIRPTQKVIERYFNQILEYNDLAPIEIINSNVFNQNKIESEKAGINTDVKSIDEQTEPINQNQIPK